MWRSPRTDSSVLFARKRVCRSARMPRPREPLQSLRFADSKRTFVIMAQPKKKIILNGRFATPQDVEAQISREESAKPLASQERSAAARALGARGRIRRPYVTQLLVSVRTGQPVKPKLKGRAKNPRSAKKHPPRNDKTDGG
jgi:hypothetical protein